MKLRTLATGILLAGLAFTSAQAAPCGDQKDAKKASASCCSSKGTKASMTKASTTTTPASTTATAASTTATTATADHCATKTTSNVKKASMTGAHGCCSSKKASAMTSVDTKSDKKAETTKASTETASTEK